MELSDEITRAAYKISTQLNDHDIVLSESVRNKINELRKEEKPLMFLPGLRGLLRKFKIICILNSQSCNPGHVIVGLYPFFSYSVSRERS